MLSVVFAAVLSSGLAPTVLSPALQAIIVDYEAVERRYDPIAAGQDGDREALSRLPDDSPTVLAAEDRDLAALEARLKALPTAGLGAEDQLDRALLIRDIGESREGFALDTARINFDAYAGFHLLPSELARGTHIRDRADADAYLARLKGLPHFYAVETANARRGIVTGFTQPLPTVDVVIAIARKQANAPLAESPLLQPFAALPPSITAIDQASLRAEALAAVRDGVKPVQAALVAFLQTEYRPHARPSLAARDLPDGERFYRFEVRRHTTTDLTPDQIHALGLSEVTRIRAEMEQAIRSAGFKGSFAEWQHHLRTDPQFYVATRQALLEKSALFAKTVDDALPHEFSRQPRLPFAVREIPRESEESATTAYYQPGSPALGIAGGYMVNTSHLDQRPLYEVPVLSLHESQPGHHLQIALAQERTDLPRFRREESPTAFVEGWALYCEQLGTEMGLYRTPEERFGQLSYEMWRACRLVADTGVHWLRWTREQARACFTDNTTLSAKNIEVELDRYISWPGQALAYKVGELRIMALRHRAETALGSRFDVRRFHDAILTDGAVPLDLLEHRIDAWIATEKARG